MNQPMLTPPPIAAIRVLVAEGSPLLARTIAEALAGAAGISVAGIVHDGVDALRRAADLRPDVLLLALDVPRGDGARVLRELMQQHPVATVMLVPESTADPELAGRLARLGAVECVPKPSLADAGDVRERLRARLVPVVRTAGRLKVVRMVGTGAAEDPANTPSGIRTPTPGPPAEPAPPDRVVAVSARRIVLIGSSTGGPEALRAVLRALPHGFPLPIVVAQHMPAGFTTDFARVLAGEIRLPVCEAVDGQRITASTVFIGRGGANLRIRSGGCIGIETPPLLDDNFPSVDVLFGSGARVYGGGVLAVVLTGMGTDGQAGVRAVREAGGFVLAQDEATSRIFGMPQAAIASGCVDMVLPLPMIGSQIMRHALAGAAR